MTQQITNQQCWSGRNKKCTRQDMYEHPHCSSLYLTEKQSTGYYKINGSEEELTTYTVCIRLCNHVSFTWKSENRRYHTTTMQWQNTYFVVYTIFLKDLIQVKKSLSPWHLHKNMSTKILF